MSEWKKIAEGLTPINNEVSFAAGKLGSFAMKKVGAGPTPGGMYKFYDANGVELTDISVAGLATAKTYDKGDTKGLSVGGKIFFINEEAVEGTDDKFYVFNNELVTEKEWGKVGTSIGITSDGIGLGKSNTHTALTKDTGDDWGENSIFTYISDFNANNETGCDDWYIGSKAEQDELINVASACGIDWYDKSTGRYIWSSVEQSAEFAYSWDCDGAYWTYPFRSGAFANYACFAMRSF